MLPQFTNMLSPLGWAILAAVPPAIVLLYFLKLRRQPLEVPSTYLWRRSIEDLHVNSIWQRLRQNLLLFLQLLLLLLLILALLRPSWSGTRLMDNRLIFIIDSSASMSSQDIEPTRLEYAKQQVLSLIDEMKSGDVGMVVSFANNAQVQQRFTDSRRALREAVEAIQPTARQTDLLEALQVASGLANPGRSATEITDEQVAEALPATVYIFSDGRFPRPDFSLGNLEPVYIPLGKENTTNVGVVAFSTSRHPEEADRLEVFANLENYDAEDALVTAELFLDGELVDAKDVELAAATQAGAEAAGEGAEKRPNREIVPGTNGVTFTLRDVSSGRLELKIQPKEDTLPTDNSAWYAINEPRRATVLLVTPGNEPLEYALETDRARELADVLVEAPGYLDTDEYRVAAAAGTFDLIIYDRCTPTPSKITPADGSEAIELTPLPQSNTLFLGSMPKLPEWTIGERVNVPQIIDVERVHPLMQLVSLGNVAVLSSHTIKPPAGGTVLVDTDQGGILAIGPRGGFEDVVLGFEVVSDEPQTNWPLRLSFPVFFMNTLQYLGGSRAQDVDQTIHAGDVFTFAAESGTDKVSVRSPTGKKVELERGPLNRFTYTDTDELGIYEVSDDKEVVRRFAVNLLDSQETHTSPEPDIQIRWQEVEGSQGFEPTRRESWKLLLLLGLAVLLFEWYIYNRRVYL